MTSSRASDVGESPPEGAGRLTIFTLGHGTHSAEDFLAIMQQYEIRRLVDVRAVPRSRHNPQFEKDSLSPFLGVRGIRYLHLKELGGWRRHVRPDPANAGWRNASFRGFADYMQTPEFVDALTKLIHLARTLTTAIMCAETVPWRCHRSLIADALVIRGVEVIDIVSRTSSKPHTLTAMARVEGSRITYPPEGRPVHRAG